MTTQHTTGPWHIGAGNGEGSIFADSGRVRLEDGGTTLYPIAQVSRGWNDVEDAANARLIAAAPDLFIALCDLLEDAVALGICESNMSGSAVAARAAIAKATGGEA